MINNISEAASIAKAAKYNDTFKTLKWEEVCFHDENQLNNEEIVMTDSRTRFFSRWQKDCKRREMLRRQLQ